MRVRSDATPRAFAALPKAYATGRPRITLIAQSGAISVRLLRCDRRSIRGSLPIAPTDTRRSRESATRPSNQAASSPRRGLIRKTREESLLRMRNVRTANTIPIGRNPMREMGPSPMNEHTLPRATASAIGRRLDRGGRNRSARGAGRRTRGSRTAIGHAPPRGARNTVPLIVLSIRPSAVWRTEFGGATPSNACAFRRKKRTEPMRAVGRPGEDATKTRATLVRVGVDITHPMYGGYVDARRLRILARRRARDDPGTVAQVRRSSDGRKRGARVPFPIETRASPAEREVSTAAWASPSIIVAGPAFRRCRSRVWSKSQAGRVRVNPPTRGR